MKDVYFIPLYIPVIKQKGMSLSKSTLLWASCIMQTMLKRFYILGI